MNDGSYETNFGFYPYECLKHGVSLFEGIRIIIGINNSMNYDFRTLQIDFYMDETQFKFG